MTPARISLHVLIAQDGNGPAAVLGWTLRPTEVATLDTASQHW